jgi:hypothetical protein
MADRACCAHIRVEWRTEIVVDGGANLRGEPCEATRGWWECTSRCGTRFQPITVEIIEIDEDGVVHPAGALA